MAGCTVDPAGKANRTRTGREDSRGRQVHEAEQARHRETWSQTQKKEKWTKPTERQIDAGRINTTHKGNY